MTLVRRDRRTDPTRRLLADALLYQLNVRAPSTETKYVRQLNNDPFFFKCPSMVCWALSMWVIPDDAMAFGWRPPRYSENDAHVVVSKWTSRGGSERNETTGVSRIDVLVTRHLGGGAEEPLVSSQPKAGKKCTPRTPVETKKKTLGIQSSGACSGLGVFFFRAFGV